MGKYDKDRHQKEMAIRYCIARGAVPCLEVLIPSASDLSDTIEVLTDIDALGLEFVADGRFRRSIFDCKTGNKTGAISRAFWAAGLVSYAGCDDAIVILKNRALYNHRISALQINVDLHDERSFEELGKTFDIEFSKDNTYQSAIERWAAIFDLYQKTKWSEELFNIGRNQAPLAKQPWRVFRKMIAETRVVHGDVDPAKDAHVVIFLDTLASAFILWSSMGRDIRRLYDPKMTKEEFQIALKYYIWGGKESYQIRQEIRQRTDANGAVQEFPAWDKFVGLAGLIITAPQDAFGCISICRDLSIRLACGKNEGHEKRLSAAIAVNKHARQFIMAVTDYLVAASGMPRDLSTRIQTEFDGL